MNQEQRPHVNLVAEIDPDRPAPKPARWRAALLLGVAAALGFGVAEAPGARLKGLCAVALFLVILGWLLGWLARTGPTLSRSGRDMSTNLYGGGGSNWPSE